MAIPSTIPCFWIEPAGKVQRYLRRYSEAGEGAASRPACPGPYSYHNAKVPFAVLPSNNRYPDPENGDNRMNVSNPGCFRLVPQNDPNWPTKCAHCDYTFQDGDNWQVCARDFYRNAAGEQKTLDEWGPGAMYHAWWEEDFSSRKDYGDGICLAISLPDTLDRVRQWTPDMPSTDGSPWTRTGNPKQPETLTARPSILCPSAPRFHAWLTNGQLEVLSDTEPWQ